MKRSFLRILTPSILMVFAFLPFSANAMTGPENSILDVAIQVNAPGGAAEGQFDTLLAALIVADPTVLEKLGGYGRHTVFAPTDAAFAAIGVDETNVGDLDRATLTQILLYHVAQGRRPATIVLASDRIFMTFGGFLGQSGGVLTDQVDRTANIIITDVFASNGVIHAIDAVVLPFGL